MQRILLLLVVANMPLMGVACDPVAGKADVASPGTDLCTPGCAGRVCGSDGCNGTCGSCGAGMLCDESSGACGPCTPNCGTATCGSDGCGGTCGACQEGEACNPLKRQCVPECQPACAGRECGDNGCGGTCGTCPGEEVCAFGTCAGGPGASCTTSSGCVAGNVCQATKCIERLCNGTADCNSGDICVDGPAVGKAVGNRYCSAEQCNATMPCPDGYDCLGGLCLPAASPDGGASDLPATGDLARPDVIEEVWAPDVPATDVPATDVPATEVPATDVPAVDVPTVDVPTADLPTVDVPAMDTPVIAERVDCRGCSTAADCGTDPRWSCLPVGSERHCLADCSTDGDCPASYICFAASTAKKACLPMAFECHPCAFDTPCDAGKVCDFQDGLCKDPQPLCGACIYDFECQAGFRCLRSTPSDGRCVPECNEGRPCADTTNFACGALASGVQLCQPKVEGKCGGCDEPTPFPSTDGSECWACLNSSHCAEGETCNKTTHLCEGSGCGLDQLRCFADGACHQCCDDNDCTMEGATGTCTDGRCDGIVEHCQGTCMAPFPVCAEVGGTWQCVQCAQTADCGGLGSGSCTCSGSPTYSCLDPDGVICGTHSCIATCSADTDCPPAADGGALVCSGPGGVCYHPKGTCDDVNACCGSGSSCYDMLPLLMAGGLGGMGVTMPSSMAYCSCDGSTPCLGGLPCSQTAMVCSLPIIGDTMCPGGMLAAGVPEGVCADLMAVMGGILGGI